MKNISLARILTVWQRVQPFELRHSIMREGIAWGILFHTHTHFPLLANRKGKEGGRRPDSPLQSTGNKVVVKVQQLHTNQVRQACNRKAPSSPLTPT